MDLSKLLHGFVKNKIMIFLSCYIDLSKLTHGFLWFVTWICQSSTYFSPFALCQTKPRWSLTKSSKHDEAPALNQCLGSVLPLAMFLTLWSQPLRSFRLVCASDLSKRCSLVAFCCNDLAFCCSEQYQCVIAQLLGFCWADFGSRQTCLFLWRTFRFTTSSLARMLLSRGLYININKPSTMLPNILENSLPKYEFRCLQFPFLGGTQAIYV